jgi:hypothetical protein
MIAALQGRVDVVSHFLSFNPKKNTSVFRSMDELIKKMPKFEVKNEKNYVKN